MKFNKSTIKIAVILVVALLIIFFISYYYVDSLYFQGGFLVTANVIYLILFSFHSNVKLWKLWYKKLIFLLIVNMIVAYLDLRFNLFNSIPDKNGYYKFIIARTFLTLMNTIITLDVVIKIITIKDVLSLPFTIHTKKKFLFFISIYNFLTDKIKLNEIVTDLIPEYQSFESSNRFLDFKFLYRRNLISIFTMLRLVHDQSFIIGELIDNKIYHTNKI